jgi:hypothetical protein
MPGLVLKNDSILSEPLIHPSVEKLTGNGNAMQQRPQYEAPVPFVRSSRRLKEKKKYRTGSGGQLGGPFNVKSSFLKLAAQAVTGPAPEIVGATMILPDTMGSEDQSSTRPQNAQSFGKIRAGGKDVFQDLS